MTQLSSLAEHDRDRVLRHIGEYRGYLGDVIRNRIDARLAARLDVSDIIQDVQIEAFRRLDGYLRHRAVPLKQWLRSLACDQVVMAKRKHLLASKRSLLRESHTNIDSSVDFMAGVSGHTKTPSCLFGKKQDAERLHHALGCLSVDDRRVIQLQVFEQLTSQEAAILLAISPEAVRQRLCRAIMRLRDQMTNEIQVADF